MSHKPKYIYAQQSGLLKERLAAAKKRIAPCHLCPRRCGVNRLDEELGICKTGHLAQVSGAFAHFGEEAPLVGSKGSGTIFFSYCNLRCNFCQNYETSHDGDGRSVTDEELAEIMLNLQNKGCHNINFVTPSHVVFQILSALEIAIEKGLCIPLVFNTGAYDCVETLKLLDGIIDIYMPDFKFWDKDIAEKTCGAANYSQIAQKAIKEMFRQVGDLKMDTDGIATEGLLLRHLVLPNKLAGTREIMHFIATQISKNTYTNIMPQYRPCGEANQMELMATHVTGEEFHEALNEARLEGILRLDKPRLFLFP
jgi:putative pyruvate formate lyase activating enzyme